MIPIDPFVFPVEFAEYPAAPIEFYWTSLASPDVRIGPSSKWVITLVIGGLTLLILIPLIIGVLTYLQTGMSHQVSTYQPLKFLGSLT